MNQKGFSMMELLIVVGIISVLSLVAVPTYKGYQAKARRQEGMNLLNTYFASAQAARGEFGFFPGNLVGTDFNPVGELGYRFRAEDNVASDPNIPLNDNTCINTSPAAAGLCECAGACVGWKQWVEKPTGVVGVSLGPTTVIIACPPLAALSVTDNNFSVRVGGVINTSADTPDRIGMDEVKQIQICQDGTQ